MNDGNEEALYGPLLTPRPRVRVNIVGCSSLFPCRPGRDANGLQQQPRLGSLIGYSIANDELGKDLTNDGRQAGVFEVFGW